MSRLDQALAQGGKRFFRTVDVGTGEVVEDAFQLLVVPKRRNGFQQEGFVAMGQGSMGLLAELCATGELQGKDMAVLMYLGSVLDQGNYIQINQSRVAKALQMKRPNVNRSIQKLLELEALLPGPKVGVHMTYRLNPEFGWKGSAKSHHQALDEESYKRQKEAERLGLRVIEGGLEKKKTDVKKLHQLRIDGGVDEIEIE